MPRVTGAALLCPLLFAVLLASCGASKKPVVVGSKNETEQMLLGEIVAQHLEHRLGRTVERRAGLGDTAILYQSIISGEVGVYPEYTGLIESDILKEPADRRSADRAGARAPGNGPNRAARNPGSSGI